MNGTIFDLVFSFRIHFLTNISRKKCNYTLFTDNIDLNIRRARISSTRCCISTCDKRIPEPLHVIPKDIRYKILKTKRFFVPATSRACNLHSDYSIWPTMNISEEMSSFNASQIEEMVDLLRSDPKPTQKSFQGKLIVFAQCNIFC